jgi:hypothetical protein
LSPDAWLQYYNAFETYPQRALAYLRNARDYEVPLIDAALPGYDVEEGRLLKDRELIWRSIPAFDPLWERDLIADAYSELCFLLKGRNERFDAAERLYALNRGALRQKGIDLPVTLTLTADGGDAALRRTLRRMGLDAVNVSDPSVSGAFVSDPFMPGPSVSGTSVSDPSVLGTFVSDPSVSVDVSGTFSPRFHLSVTVANGEAHCVLRDRGRGIEVFRQTIPLKSSSRRDLAAFARILGDGLFIEK